MKRIVFLPIILFSLLAVSACTSEPVLETEEDAGIFEQQLETEQGITDDNLKTEGLGTEATEIMTIGVLQAGQVCEPGVSQCAPGLKCGYPCGIQGCEHVCMPEDELPKP